MVDHYGRVKLTNPDKVLYPATGTTKAEVFDYYVGIADVMLPHIAGRPATRKRWPNGVDEASFFEKQLASSAPDWLNRASITHRSSPSRPRWKYTSRNGASSRAGAAGRVKTHGTPGLPPAWCSILIPVRASR